MIGGICRKSHQPDECSKRPFQGESECRTVAQTRLAVSKSFGPRWHSLKKECLRCQVINLAPPEKEPWTTPPRGSTRACFGTPDMNAGSSLSMLGGLNRRDEAKLKATRNPITAKHGHSLTQVAMNSYSTLLRSSDLEPHDQMQVIESAYSKTHKQNESVA